MLIICPLLPILVLIRIVNPSMAPSELQRSLSRSAGLMPLCSPDSIGLLLTNPALHSATLLHANHHPDVPQCAQPFPPGSPILRLEVPLQFLPCGVKSRRLSFPKIGLEHSLRALLNFNTNDSQSAFGSAKTLQRRVFDIRCRYYPERNQSVGRVLELSAHQSSFVVQESHTRQAMAGGPPLQPQCKYSIHTNSVDGPSAIGRVQLGERVFHRWRCGDEYALKVYRCFVHDGRSKRHQIINDQGCSTDLLLMPHPAYSANFSNAVAASRVFRFSSSARVFFDCLLYACLKRDPECRRMTHSQCGDDSFAQQPKLRRRRRGTANNEFIFSKRSEVTIGEDDQTMASSAGGATMEGVIMDEERDKDSARQMRSALKHSQKAVKALAVLNAVSLSAAVLLGCALCAQRRRRFSATLSFGGAHR